MNRCTKYSCIWATFSHLRGMVRSDRSFSAIALSRASCPAGRVAGFTAGWVDGAGTVGGGASAAGRSPPPASAVTQINPAAVIVASNESRAMVLAPYPPGFYDHRRAGS
jgi:hypothetical protein